MVTGLCISIETSGFGPGKPLGEKLGVTEVALGSAASGFTAGFWSRSDLERSCWECDFNGAGEKGVESPCGLYRAIDLLEWLCPQLFLS